MSMGRREWSWNIALEVHCRTIWRPISGNSAGTTSSTWHKKLQKDYASFTNKGSYIVIFTTSLDKYFEYVMKRDKEHEQKLEELEQEREERRQEQEERKQKERNEKENRRLQRDLVDVLRALCDQSGGSSL
jgi:predicted ribosome quality control (RQC) complex YloA/Tae2 family protein